MKTQTNKPTKQNLKCWI